MGIAANSRAARLTSFDPADFARPSGRQEQWRFAPVGDLAQLYDAGLAAQVVTRVGGPLASGVEVDVVGKDHPGIGLAPPPGDRIAAAAWAAVDSASLVTLSGSDPGALTRLDVMGQESLELIQPSAAHLAILARPNARGTVLLAHSGLAQLAQGVEIVLEEGADITVIALAGWADGAIHAASHRARLAKDARLTHFAVALGGSVVRLAPHIELAGDGAQARAFGVNLTGSGQHHEAQLFIDHQARNCHSRATYKGALLGPSARSVWVGDVLIRAGAEGTDSYEENRNLVLAKGARADSVPNLEIETGRIEGAGHASATGRFDEEQLFYLQARGIPAELARSLVVHAFFAELIGRIGHREIEAALTAAVDAKLNQQRNVAT
ncbi:MAG: SufD family Fe-S cluster assembly protein [Bifidobacteriaceae bacterium]|jgi:Fe-S cluster assembly protein SufD|nr:SufD family Fe-S cluster assembly protein [Bifidobacteriaceae bacterium]